MIGPNVTAWVHDVSPKPALARRPIAPTVLPVVLLIVSAMLRFGGLDGESRWCDEYQQTACYGQGPWSVVLAARAACQPPLDYLVGWAVHRVDPSLWAMRAPAALFGVVSIALTFAFIRRLADWPTALLAAGWVAFSPVHWRMSQTARPYTIFLTAMLLTMWSLAAVLQRPDRRRLALYAAASLVMVLTRGMAPPVILLATAVTLVVFAWRARDVIDKTALRRALWVTIAAGVVSGGVTLFLVMGDQSWTVFSQPGSGGLPAYAAGLTHHLMDNFSRWAAAGRDYFGSAGVAVVVLATIGLLAVAAAWRRLPLVTRVLVVIALVAGGLFPFVYTLAVRQWPLSYRYAFFLLPTVAGLAGVGSMYVGRWIVRWIVQWIAQPAPRADATARVVGLVIGGALIAIPARATIHQSQTYVHPDWRGCAAYLARYATPQDVILVLQDRPLGEYQPTFWGKYDWPAGRGRPLAEAAWTFVTSQPHWRRLLGQHGKCYVVIRRAVGSDRNHRANPDEYNDHGGRGRGVQGATTYRTPDGLPWVRFRGLDVLLPPADDCGLKAVASACRRAMGAALEHDDARVYLLALSAKVERANRHDRAADQLYGHARRLVPPRLRAWFEQSVERAAPQ